MFTRLHWLALSHSLCCGSAVAVPLIRSSTEVCKNGWEEMWLTKTEFLLSSIKLHLLNITKVLCATAQYVYYQSVITKYYIRICFKLNCGKWHLNQQKLWFAELTTFGLCMCVLYNMDYSPFQWLSNSSVNHHLILVEEFMHPNDPCGYAAWGNYPW